MTTAPHASRSTRIAQRLGLPATGLGSLSPREVWAWLDRVRAGGLEPTERAATVVLIYRVWLIALLLKALGSGWDVAWHFRFIRDDFAPPHNLNLLGDGVAIALVLFHWYTRLGVDKMALRLMAGGVAVFVLAAPVDVINHRLNGLDITSWSATHFGLYVGTGIMIAGVIRGWHAAGRGLPRYHLMLGAYWFFFLENVWFPAQHQEYGVEAIAAWDRGDPYAEPSLLQFAADQLGRAVDREAVVGFALPVPAWVYPVWTVVAAGLTLVLARRMIGWRWAATALAGAFVVWRCVLYPLLLVGGFPPSAVPFAILALGVAIDLVCMARLPAIAEAALGAVAVTAAMYAALAAQSSALIAPPVSYASAGAAAALLFAGWTAVRLLIAAPDASPVALTR
jgi:hypothetical protein